MSEAMNLSEFFIGLATGIFMILNGAFLLSAICLAGSRYLLTGRLDQEDTDALTNFASIIGLALGVFGAYQLGETLDWNPTASIWIGISCFLLVLLGAFMMLRFRGWTTRLKGRRGEARVRKEISKLPYDALHNVYLETNDRVTQIDHLVKAGGRIVVIETKCYDKAVFAGPNDDSWSLQQKNAKEQVPNPLRQNAGHVAAVKYLTHADAEGLVVVMNFTAFPKGDIPGVIKVSKVSAYLDAVAETSTINQATDRAWQKLVDLASPPKQSGLEKKHEAYLLRRHTLKAATPTLGLPPAKPKCCSKCNGDTFHIAVATDGAHVWKCDACGQWHRMNATGGRVVVKGDDHIWVGDDGVEVMLHSPQRKSVSFVPLAQKIPKSYSTT